MNGWTVTAVAVTLELCAPVSAQTFETCRGEAQDWRSKEVASRCASLTGEVAVSCQRRIAETYVSMVDRCRAADDDRRRREAAVAKERATADRLRADAARQQADQRQQPHP